MQLFKASLPLTAFASQLCNGQQNKAITAAKLHDKAEDAADLKQQVVWQKPDSCVYRKPTIWFELTLYLFYHLV